jgi:hypothetical protein
LEKLVAVPQHPEFSPLAALLMATESLEDTALGVVLQGISHQHNIAH